MSMKTYDGVRHYMHRAFAIPSGWMSPYFGIVSYRICSFLGGFKIDIAAKDGRALSSKQCSCCRSVAPSFSDGAYARYQDYLVAEIVNGHCDRDDWRPAVQEGHNANLKP